MPAIRASTGAGTRLLRHVTERSVLNAPGVDALPPFEVAGRKRRATCSGVAWFKGHHLAVVNLYGNHLRIYRLQRGLFRPRLRLLHEFAEGLSRPEDVAVAPDGARLAITHSMSAAHGVSVHALDARTLAPGPGLMLRRGVGYHGIRFSADGRHLAFTDVGEPGSVEVLAASTPDWPRTCRLENHDAPLKPKSVCFSRDGRFAAIVKTLNVRQQTGALAAAGQLAVHAFDAGAGMIAPAPLAVLHAADATLGNVELATFLPTPPGAPYRLLVANQGADAVNAFAFDPERRTLAFTGVFADGLSFPHGLDVSADGRYVAVTNYGDDTLCIWRAPTR